MKLLSYLLLSLALLLSACLFDSDTEEEKESKSSSSTEVISSSSSAKVTSSSSSVTTNKSSSSGTVVNSSSSSENPPESSSSSLWVDYPYYSSGVFCFTEGCEDNPTSSSSSEEPSSSSVVIVPSSSSVVVLSSSSQQDAVIEDGVMVDKRDEQRYELTSLNGKTWMAQSINYETATGSTCYENNDTYCDVYGRLYTYEAAQSACPGGWHIATRAEFEEAKAEPTFLWLYAGRMSNNAYNFVDGMGFHWVDGPIESSDNQNCSSDQCALIFVQKNPDSDYAADPALFFQKDNKTKGFSVRCVKN